MKDPNALELLTIDDLIEELGKRCLVGNVSLTVEESTDDGTESRHTKFRQFGDPFHCLGVAEAHILTMRGELLSHIGNEVE